MNLTVTILSGATLTEADLSFAKLTQAPLTDADLTDVNLGGGAVYGADGSRRAITWLI